MSKFVVLDVGHGLCCYAIADNGNSIVFDCGHKSEPEIRPSNILPHTENQTSIDLLVITNYDEDHISDIAGLRRAVEIKQLRRNKSISAEQLRALKLKQSGEISESMKSLLDMISSYTGDPLSPVPEFPGIHNREHFSNNHPFGDNDTNNISLVTLVDIGDDTFLIPGDIEKDGWARLLADNQSLRKRLPDVTYYIASHHGRENGYYEEIFTQFGCRPKCFVFSDDAKQYTTQETTNRYSQWASGITFNGQSRYVLTTRNDGTLTWTY